MTCNDDRTPVRHRRASNHAVGISWLSEDSRMSASADGVALEVDHMQPVSKGGTNDEENLWTLCKPCNQGKRDSLA